MLLSLSKAQYIFFFNVSAVKDVYLKISVNIYPVIFLNIQPTLVSTTPEYDFIAELKKYYIHIVTK